MFIGPVFAREWSTAPRRPRLYVARTVYAAVLFGVMCTAWLILTGTQVISNVGDMARFGAILFQLLAPLQLAIVVFFSAVASASAVAHEKDRKTLLLLLITRLNNSELVLGKLFASLLQVITMVATGVPVFALLLLFGGVSLQQVVRVTLVAVATAVAAGSLGNVIAFWREKTFQTLALTAMVLVGWLLGCEAIQSGIIGERIAGVDATRVATMLSPVRATLAAARPSAEVAGQLGWHDDVNRFIVFAGLSAVVLNAIGIWRVRVWNPSREVRAVSAAVSRSQESIWGAEHDLALEQKQPVERTSSTVPEFERPAYRHAWKNPVLWREVCTWAYGRKVIGIRLAYVALALAVTAAVVWSGGGQGSAASRGETRVISSAAWPAIPFFVVSLVMINALAVTTITTERDGKCLDLLLVTDLSPGEFLWGKLAGTAWVTKEMWLLPLAFCILMASRGQLSWQNLVYVSGGLFVLDVFVTMLGLHCGRNYANSRAAIAVSLGTVFFLFLGITICIVMMISFSGSFQIQLAPFLAFILGGGFGLYVALGARNPSGAILWASLVLPFATFYAITSFLMDYTLGVFLITAAAYGFTTAAMLVPAVAEFDFASSRSLQT